MFDLLGGSGRYLCVFSNECNIVVPYSYTREILHGSVSIIGISVFITGSIISSHQTVDPPPFFDDVTNPSKRSGSAVNG